MTSPRISTNVHEAADVLLRGGIIGLPTETVYGLAALAEVEEAVMRVFSTKGRPTNHPLIIHLGTSVNPEEWGKFNLSASALAREFWPGPLTLLVPRTERVPNWVTGGRDTVALRVPSHPLAQQLLNEVKTGVVAPSANRFGKVSPTTAEHVVHDLGSDVDLVLDGGACMIGVESTIVECIGGTVTVLRPGSISSDDILRVTALSMESQNEDLRAPGMLASHYAPRAQVLLFDKLLDAEEKVRELTAEGKTSRVLNHADVNVYAERLYADLRDADASHVEVVCAVLPSREGVGTAVRDRLAKAANR